MLQTPLPPPHKGLLRNISSAGFFGSSILIRDNPNGWIGLKIKVEDVGVIFSTFSLMWRYLNVHLIQLELTWGHSDEGY